MDTNGWLTRNEAADLLRCSVQTLRNHEQRGKLHPAHVTRSDAMGAARVTIVYNPKELAVLPRYEQPKTARDTGEVAARSYELFYEGKSDNDLVIALREPPDKVIELREKWLDGGAAHFVISPQAKAELEKIIGPFSSIAEVIKLANLMISSQERAAFEEIVGPFSSATELLRLVVDKCSGSAYRKA